MAALPFNRRPALRALLFAAPLALALGGCGVNTIPTEEENAKAKWADVQNQYQRRADLIPNLVATVKGYANHEEKTLTEVVEARAKATSVTVNAGDITDPAKMKAFQEAQGQLSQGLGRLLANTEAYPDLKANTNFLALQSQLEGTENRITVARKDYNEAVREYNTTIRTFPALIGAKVIYGSKPIVPFEATTPGAEKAPTISFDSAPAAAVPAKVN
jgi:LemA protein